MIGAVAPDTPDGTERRGLSEQELADAPQFVRVGLAALRRAAAMAREIAIQTDTGIVIVRDGKPVVISGEELRAQQLATGSQINNADTFDSPVV